MSDVKPEHAEIAMKLQAALKDVLPPGFKICAMIVDTTGGAMPYPMFVVRNVSADVSREIAGAFADGSPSVTVRVVEVPEGAPN